MGTKCCHQKSFELYHSMDSINQKNENNIDSTKLYYYQISHLRRPLEMAPPKQNNLEPLNIFLGLEEDDYEKLTYFENELKFQSSLITTKQENQLFSSFPLFTNGEQTNVDQPFTEQESSKQVTGQFYQSKNFSGSLKIQSLTGKQASLEMSNLQFHSNIPSPKFVTPSINELEEKKIDQNQFQEKIKLQSFSIELDKLVQQVDSSDRNQSIKNLKELKSPIDSNFQSQKKLENDKKSQSRSLYSKSVDPPNSNKKETSSKNIQVKRIIDEDKALNSQKSLSKKGILKKKTTMNQSQVYSKYNVGLSRSFYDREIQQQNQQNDTTSQHTSKSKKKVQFDPQLNKQKNRNFFF